MESEIEISYKLQGDANAASPQPTLWVARNLEYSLYLCIQKYILSSFIEFKIHLRNKCVCPSV